MLLERYAREPFKHCLIMFLKHCVQLNIAPIAHSDFHLINKIRLILLSAACKMLDCKWLEISNLEPS